MDRIVDPVLGLLVAASVPGGLAGAMLGFVAARFHGGRPAAAAQPLHPDHPDT